MSSTKPETPRKVRGRPEILWHWARGLQVVRSPDGKYVVTHPQSRAAALELSAPLGSFFSRLRRPRAFLDAVAEAARHQKMDAFEALAELEPLFRQFVESGLVEKAQPARMKVAPSSGKTLRVHSCFRSYQVERCIRQLADGEIFRVTDIKSREPHILKIAPGRGLRNGKGPNVRLAREFEILKALEGTSACALVETGLWRGRRYGILEFVPGKNIQQHADRMALPSLDPVEAMKARVNLFSEALAALEAIHARGFLHGDPHPGNFLASPNGQIRVVDFGCAQRFRANGQGESGYLGGVLEALPPEVAGALLSGSSRVPWSKATEIYSMAAAGFRLISGGEYILLRPYRREALEDIVEKPPRQFSETGALAWPAIEMILRAALSKNPRARPKSLSAFRRALVKALAASSPSLRKRGRVTRAETKRLSEFGASWLYDVKRASPEDTGASASLANGAAGVAYLLWRNAVLHDDADSLAHAYRWVWHAKALSKRRDAFRVETHDGKGARLRDFSLLFGRPGVAFVAALVSHAIDDRDGYAKALSDLRSLSCAETLPSEYVGGVAGLLAAGTRIFAETGDERARSWSDEMAKTLIARAFGDGGNSTIWPDVNYQGYAHGIGGLFHTLLDWAVTCDRHLPEWFEPRLGIFAETALPTPHGINWAMERTGKSTRFMTSWCHGAPGLLLLWTLAYKCYRREEFKTVASNAGRQTAEFPNTVASLCCGLAGRGYALLELARIDKNPQWPAAAHNLALKAVGQAHLSRNRFSLLKGDGGIAALARDLAEAPDARIPIFSR